MVRDIGMDVHREFAQLAVLEIIPYSKGVPSGITPVPAPPTTPRVVWAPAGRIYVVTMGSGSCPNLPVTSSRTGLIT